MDRRERNALLERLVAYRRVYHLRSDYDSKPVITVAAAVAYGERLARSAVWPPSHPASPRRRPRAYHRLPARGGETWNSWIWAS